MPNIITHSWYGETAFVKANIDELRKIIRDNHGLFMFGCQGPDFFYFYHRWPWESHKDSELVFSYADIIHTKHINETFRCFLEHTKASKNKQEIAYVAGFLCHWAIDMTCHPYIFYRTDSLYEDIGRDHQLFETQIDKGILQEFSIDIRDFQTTKLMKHTKEEMKTAYGLVKEALWKCDEIALDFKHFKDSFEGFYNLQKLFYDPNYSKFSAVGKLETAFGLKGLATSMMIPEKYDEQWDAMNYEKKEWLNPCNKEEKFTDSFKELAARGLSEEIVILKMYEDYLFNDLAIETILDEIDDRSFSTGKHPDVVMQYFEKDLKKEQL